MKERRPRPRLSGVDRLFWVLLRRLWPRWDHVLVLVEPATVVRWHRAGFRLWWRWKSRAMKPGRPRIERELRSLIRRMAQENPVWGAPRIHAELSKLGFEVSERTVSRYLPRRLAPKDVVERWKAFLRNHRADIAAMDLFTVPTASFGVLYVFFVIHHARRRVLHFGVTGYPKSAWVIQQLWETFPDDEAPCFLVFDRDSTFGDAVVATIRSFGIEPKRTSFRSPWQNGIAERWVGSVRREVPTRSAGPCGGPRRHAPPSAAS